MGIVISFLMIVAGAAFAFALPQFNVAFPPSMRYMGYGLCGYGVLMLLIFLAKRPKDEEEPKGDMNVVPSGAFSQKGEPQSGVPGFRGVTYDLDDVEENEDSGLFFDIAAGDVIEKITGATGREIGLSDGNGGEYFFRLLWRGVEERNGKKRLYCALQSQKQEKVLYVLFAVKSPQGDTALFLDGADENRAKIIEGLNNVSFGSDGAAAQAMPESEGRAEEPVRKKGGKFILSRFADKFALESGETDKLRIPALIAMTVVYLLVLAAGLIGYFTAFGFRDEKAAALCRGICLLYVLVTPSYLVYFGARNPLRMKKGVANVVLGLGCAGLVVCAFIGITKDYPLVDVVDFAVLSLNLSTYMIFSLVIGVVAYIYAYAVLCKGCKSGLYLGIGATVTLLFPVAAIVLLLLFVLALALTLLNMVLQLVGGSKFGKGFVMGWTGKGGSEGEYSLIDEHGYERTLTHYEGNRYRDDTGAFWVSDDNGNTFRRD